jgi:hypothetical protein
MLLCGPFCFYKDYIAFVEGRNYITDSAKKTVENSVS